MIARPLFKSAGGKTSLLPTILEYVPSKIGTYYEPFVGGGAVFFALANQERFSKAVLNDNNAHLVTVYKTVRDDPACLISELRWYKKHHDKKGKDFYLKIRAQAPNKAEDDDLTFAAWFMYLNATCFNGLWRVNKKGEFNVPFGDYKKPNIVKEDLIWACSEVLQGVKVMCGDFERSLSKAKKGDFVLADPPYLPRLKNDFVSYTKDRFGYDDHVRLRDSMLALKKRGANVMITNSGTDEVEQLYSKGFKIRETPGRRSVGATGERRGYVGDFLIT